MGLLIAAGCEGPPPALEVGAVHFSDDDLIGLSDDRLQELALISVLVAARLGGEEERIGAAAREGALREARVRGLREEITLEVAGVTEAELRARYEADPAYELEVRHLVVLSERWRPEAHRSDAADRAAAALDRIRSGEAFQDVVGEVSEEPGAARRGGLLQPGREGTWVREFWEAASALAPGEVSGVVESEFGFHVLRLESRETLPFEASRTGVVREVALQLGGVDGWEAWREERLADLELDREAVLALQPSPPPLTRLADGTGFDAPTGPEDAASGAATGAPGAPGASPVATWEGGELSEAAFVERLRGEPVASWRTFRDGTEAERLEIAERIAVQARLDRLARERGIEPEDGDRARIDREWERHVLTWTAFLEIPERVTPEAAPALALAALRSNDQNARIARSELSNWAPTLLATYPVHLRGAGSSTTP